ncbi:MAG: glutamine amidotransferase [Planctomycetota bacterium]
MFDLSCYSILHELFPGLSELFPGFASLVLMALAVVVVVLTTLFYRQAYAALSSWQWKVLYGLRLLAIGIVLLLLLRPVLSFQQEVQRPKTVVFAVDNSASMGISDTAQEGTRWEQACDQVQQLWPELHDIYDLRLVAFSDRSQHLESPSKLGGVQAEGSATSLSRGLLSAERSASGKSTEAVVLFSDGIQNTAGSPVAIARRLGTRVITIGTGDPRHDRSMRRDIRVTDVDCPDRMAVENKTRVTGFVEARGMPGRLIRVQLLEDEKPVSERELVLDDIEGAQEVVFEFVPKEKGLHTYTVKVPHLADEKIPRNNTRSTSALVQDARIRVLYLEGTLRSEYGALVGRFLSKDPNIEFCALVQTRPNQFVRRTNIDGLELDRIPDDSDTLESFDVILVGDLSAAYLPEARARMIHDRVNDGAGFMMIGGYHSLGPGGYTGTRIEQLLPVRLGGEEVGQATDPFQPQLTGGGRTHPIFANIAEFFAAADDNALKADLPPLDGCVKVAAARPGASVLLVHPELAVAESSMVVMAVQRVGEGRTAVFTADTTRKWHQALRMRDQKTPFLRFWGQTIRWLAGRNETMAAEAGIVATTDKSYYTPEAEVTVSATVRGEDGAAAAQADVTATIEGPGVSAAPLSLAAKAGPAGHYAAAFRPSRPGRYTISVTARVGDRDLAADELEIDVGRPSLEFDRLDLDQATLVNIANETGGQYMHVSLADRLATLLKERYERQRVRREVSLAWPPVMWVLFVATVTCEWLLRRRYQLR